MNSTEPSPPDIEAVAACERERLHEINAIQPWGALLGGRRGDDRVRVWSRNARDWIGDRGKLRGRPLDELLPLSGERLPDHPGQKRLIPGLLDGPRGCLDAVLSCGEAVWLVELQPSESSSDGTRITAPLQGELFRAPRSASDFESYLHTLAQAMRVATGFERVMVYRFLPDACGEVLAESCAEGPPRYLGLRFPASDIPRIARDLYGRNAHRQIPDAQAAPEPLEAEPDLAMDLTFSDLRAVSPMHVQYLRNMAVRASLSFSITVAGSLWGLVACHHTTPRHLPATRRERAYELVQTFALGVGSFQAHRRLQRMDAVDGAVERIAELLANPASERDEAVLEQALLAALNATGAALIGPERTRTFGRAPQPRELSAIDQWFRTRQGEPLFATDRLSAACGISVDPARAAGLLALRGARPLREPAGSEACFYWFRPEQSRVVRWAGNPAKPALTAPEQGDPLGPEQLGPRHSFDLWLETVRGLSAPWEDMDLLVAKKLRHLILRHSLGGGL